LDFLQNKLI